MHINPSGETWNPLKRATFPPHYKLNAYIIDLQKKKKLYCGGLVATPWAMHVYRNFH